MNTTSLFWGKYPYRIKVVVRAKKTCSFFKAQRLRYKHMNAIEGISPDVKIIDCYMGFSAFFLTEEHFNKALSLVPAEHVTEKNAPKNEMVLQSLLANPLSVIRSTLWDNKFRYKLTFQQRDWKTNRLELRSWLIANGLEDEKDFRIQETPYVLLREEEDMMCLHLMFGTSVIKQQNIILYHELENGNA